MKASTSETMGQSAMPATNPNEAEERKLWTEHDRLKKV